MNDEITKQELTELLCSHAGTERLIRLGGQAVRPACELFAKPESPKQAVSAAALLARLAKRSSCRSEINRFFSDRSALLRALKSDVPKLRKNAARLLGALCCEKDASALAEALLTENTRFVRPSIILALGSVGGPVAEQALKSYRVPPSLDESQTKHHAEESFALKSAVSKLLPGISHGFTGLKDKTEIELRAHAGFVRQLSDEIEELGFLPRQISGESILAETDDIERLFKARSFYEALFPVACGIPLSAKAIAEYKGNCMDFLSRVHEGGPPFTYRLEIKADTDRGALAKETAMLLDSEGFINSPSGYEAELRVEASRSTCDLFIKLCTFEDKRFAYRLRALPASIKPSMASALLRYARHRLKIGAKVLDPCCGSGTMLIERGMLCPCSELTGLDISGYAVGISRENSRAANIKAKFIRMNCLDFIAKQPFDEVISNLPFGNRVGSHAGNKLLYGGLARKLTEWLAPGGTAVFYTMEHNLLKKCIIGTKGLKLLSETNTEAGGLLPHLIIIQRISD